MFSFAMYRLTFLALYNYRCVRVASALPLSDCFSIEPLYSRLSCSRISFIGCSSASRCSPQSLGVHSVYLAC
ncbi:hypothetical protein GGI35DRAFT_462272 [Trichoderma velutinum]